MRGVKQPGDAGAVGVAPVGEMVEKLRGAVAACRGTEIQILARCDAVALEGMEGAMRRADRYLAAGAHGLFIPGVPTVAGLREVGRRFGGSHLMIAMFEGRETWLPPAELHAMGFRQVVFPGLLMPRVVDCLDRALRDLRAHAEAGRRCRRSRMPLARTSRSKTRCSSSAGDRSPRQSRPEPPARRGGRARSSAVRSPPFAPAAIASRGRRSIG